MQPIVIPVQAINILTVVVLLFLLSRLWGTLRRGSLPTLKAFTWFFVFVLGTMILAVLPGLVITDLSAVQLVYNLSHFLLVVAIAFFFRMTMLFVVPTKKLLTVHIPLAFVLAGAVLFLLQALAFSPVHPPETGSLPGLERVQFVDYPNAAPIGTSAAQGGMSLFVFLTATTVFFRQAVKTENSLLRKRSLLIGLGCASAAIAVLANFILGVGVQPVIAFFIASIGTLLSIVLVYLGVRVQGGRQEPQPA